MNEKPAKTKYRIICTAIMCMLTCVVSAGVCTLAYFCQDQKYDAGRISTGVFDSEHLLTGSLATPSVMMTATGATPSEADEEGMQKAETKTAAKPVEEQKTGKNGSDSESIAAEGAKPQNTDNTAGTGTGTDTADTGTAAETTDTGNGTETTAADTTGGAETEAYIEVTVGPEASAPAATAADTGTAGSEESSSPAAAIEPYDFAESVEPISAESLPGASPATSYIVE